MKQFKIADMSKTAEVIPDSNDVPGGDLEKELESALPQENVTSPGSSDNHILSSQLEDKIIRQVEVS